MTDNTENPYQAPKSAVDVSLAHNASHIWRKKSQVVVTRETIWPKRCIKCNAPTEKSLNRKLAYVNPWIYLSILISLLITIILVLIFQKKFKMDLPLCEMHSDYRKRVILINWLLALLAGGGFWIFLAEISEFGLVASLVLVLVMVIIGFSNRIAYIARYKDPYIYVKGAKREFLDSLNEFEQQ